MLSHWGSSIEDLASTVNWIGASAADIDTAVLYEGGPWFGDSSCDVDYNVRAISFDKTNAKLVLKVESSDFE